jgi:hypothetical protein
MSDNSSRPRERLGLNRIPAEAGNGGVESGFTIGEVSSQTRGDFDLGIMLKPDRQLIGLGLACHMSNIEQLNTLGLFTVDDARTIANTILQLCDELEDNESAS